MDHMHMVYGISCQAPFRNGSEDLGFDFYQEFAMAVEKVRNAPSPDSAVTAMCAIVKQRLDASIESHGRIQSRRSK